MLSPEWYQLGKVAILATKCVTIYLHFYFLATTFIIFPEHISFGQLRFSWLYFLPLYEWTSWIWLILAIMWNIAIWLWGPGFNQLLHIFLDYSLEFFGRFLVHYFFLFPNSFIWDFFHNITYNVHTQQKRIGKKTRIIFLQHYMIHHKKAVIWNLLARSDKFQAV